MLLVSCWLAWEFPVGPPWRLEVPVRTGPGDSAPGIRDNSHTTYSAIRGTRISLQGPATGRDGPRSFNSREKTNYHGSPQKTSAVGVPGGGERAWLLPEFNTGDGGPGGPPGGVPPTTYAGDAPAAPGGGHLVVSSARNWECGGRPREHKKKTLDGTSKNI